ncbi:MAG: hypothetical protein QNJ72_09750 [Pleurocapsa sp. MO_226.B13]|nr:hypothetical protein [Pleurocapsa sp. MO_226.B13]
MSIAKIYEFLFATETKIYTRRSLFWLSLGLIFSLVYSLIALRKAFDGDYLVQDDARQHVFWMRRFLDPELFPNDLIANYYQSIAPWGYKNFYRIAATVGIDPLVFNKFVPGMLGIVMTVYCFAVSLSLLPLPFGAFTATLIFNQNIWSQAGLISGTARDFVYPLFFIFLYYWLRRSLLGVCLTLVLMSWFYPSLVLICGGVLFWQLWRIDGYIPRLCRDKQVILFSCISLGVAFVVLLPYVLAASEYGPTTTLEQARSLPEFIAGGRAGFFHDRDPWRFWFNASRTGIKLPSALVPQLAYGGLLLPILLKFPQKFTLISKINPRISYLRDLLIVSFGLFFAAHALLFKLYLPSRYTARSLKVTIILAASISLMLILEAVWRWAIASKVQSKVRPLIALSILIVFCTTLVGYPATRNNFINTGYQRGQHPELYQFLQQQPKDIVIASLTEEADLIPSLTQRSVLVAREYAIPYHMGYYQPFRQRVVDLIEAQYTTDLKIVKDFIHRYGVDFWLVDRSSFTPEYLEENRWLRDHQPVTQAAIENLKRGELSAIALLPTSCNLFQDTKYTVLSSKCILKQE